MNAQKRYLITLSNSQTKYRNDAIHGLVFPANSATTVGCVVPKARACLHVKQNNIPFTRLFHNELSINLIIFTHSVDSSPILLNHNASNWITRGLVLQINNMMTLKIYKIYEYIPIYLNGFCNFTRACKHWSIIEEDH